MATRTRRPPARRKPARRPPARSVTITLGPRPVGSTRGRRRHRSGWLTFTIWLARWTGRAAAWTGRQAAGRATGHYQRTAESFHVWRDAKAEHGLHTPVVYDLHEGTAHKAHEVRLDAPTGGDPEVRGRQAEDAQRRRERVEQARADAMMRHVRPPLWRRALGLVDWNVYEESLRARMAVLARRRGRLAREGALYSPPVMQPAPSAAGSGGRAGLDDPSLVTVPTGEAFTSHPHFNRTRGDGSMANPIRQWADLADPQIDPFEFPEELPQHFSEVARLLADEAAMMEAATDSGQRGADTFAGYTEYLNSAGIHPRIIGSIVDAREEINNAVALLRQATEAMARAANLAEAAQRAAEAEYGDFEMPRFDQANAG